MKDSAIEHNECKMKTYKQKIHKWQKMYGGLSTEIQSKMNKLVNEFEKTSHLPQNKLSIIKSIQPTEGTRFIREYNGKKHEVLALAKGFQYKNKVYNSLSAIAYDITNTKWNGKRFFGVCK